jgi:hypothetical protein
MATKLNKRAFEHAKNLISKGKCIQDEKDKWTNLQKMKTRAGQYKHTDIENAVAHLHGMLDK